MTGLKPKYFQIDDFLDRRLHQLERTDHRAFHSVIERIWSEIIRDTEPVSTLLERLFTTYPDADSLARRIFRDGVPQTSGSPEFSIAIAAYAVRRCAEGCFPSKTPELIFGKAYSDPAPPNVYRDSFLNHFVRPVFDYIREHIEDHEPTHALFIKYKKRVEWFRRTSLRTLYENDTKNGEDNLWLDFLEFLHELDYVFTRVPHLLGSGKPDTILTLPNGKQRIIEGKVFSQGMSASTVGKWYGQISRYNHDISEPFNYLLIFNTTDRHMKFLFAEEGTNIAHFPDGNRTTYFVDVELYPHPTASNEPRQSKTNRVEITAEHLIKGRDEVSRL